MGGVGGGVSYNCSLGAMGKRMEGKEMEVEDNRVDEKAEKYKKVENIDGPTYSEDKDNVAAIKYKNGTQDIFPEVKPWLKLEKNKKEETNFKENHRK